MYKAITRTALIYLSAVSILFSAEINPQLKNPDFNFLFESSASLAKPYSQREACSKLITAHIDKFKDKILEKLKSEKPIEKQTSLSIISKTGRLEFEKAVIETLLSGNILVKESAAHTLFNIYINMSAVELVDRFNTYKTANSNNEEFILPAVVAALAENNYQINDTLLPALTEAAEKEKPALSKACFSLFMKQKSTVSKAGIFKKLAAVLEKSSNDLIKSDSAEILYVFDTAAVPLLQEMMNADNACLQIASAFSLAKIGDSAGLDMLHQALLVKNISLKLKTIDYLKELRNPFSEKHLAANLDSANRAVIIKSSEALGALEGKAITPGLRRLLQDSDMKVVSAAAIALKNQGALGIHWRLINSRLSSIKNEGEVISAINTLAVMKSAQAEDRLHELIFSENKKIAAAACRALGEIKAKQKKTQYALIQTLGNSSYITAINAAEALQKISHLPFLKKPEQSAKNYKETLNKKK
ncbi:MAG: HEAT repeat domain-containing protein [Planctomycetota bacterium]|jgi:HEAT repeat protein